MKAWILALLAAMTLTMAAGESHAKNAKFRFTSFGQNGLSCNLFLWYTSSWSTSSDSCDYIVPLVKNKNEELRRFVETNQERLMEEMSQGQGPVLTDYALLLGCSADSVPAFSKATQENFTRVFGGAKNSEDILKNTRESLTDEKVLQEKCTTHLS